jgi:3-methyladenine DNA glycosylase AlkC
MFERGSSFSEIVNNNSVKILASKLKNFEPTFKDRAFVSSIDLEPLKFLDRIRAIAKSLNSFLPPSFEHTIATIKAVAMPEIPEYDAGTTYGEHFIMLALGELVVLRGLKRETLHQALEILKFMTKSCSSESSVRPFIIRFPEETLAYLYQATRDPNVHVRRWASEGTRPRLPWAPQIKTLVIDPTPILPILEALRDDKHAYVRRSVANSLNDISKDHPRLLTRLLKSWTPNLQDPPTRLQVIQHGLRTLVKRADPDALKLLGYRHNSLKITGLKISKKVAIGEDFLFSFSITNESTSDGAVLIDYVITFCKKKGTGEKVFKFRKLNLSAGEKVTLQGKRRLDHFSTRKMYPGHHAFSLQVNGKRIQLISFTVT